MSRNKIIKMVHDYTGKSYKACRAFCKYHHWNEYQIKAMLFCIDADAMEDLTKAFDGISKAIFEAGAKIAAGLAALCDNMGAAFRDQSDRMRKISEQYNINKAMDDAFNYSDTITATILNPSEVRENIIKEDLQNETLSIEEIREQFGLNPFPDVNDPHTPVFAPYYASTAGNGKLYQDDGGRNTDETGA